MVAEPLGKAERSNCFAKCADLAAIFKPADLVHAYEQQLKALGVNSQSRVNSTRLKQRLMAGVPGLQAFTKSKGIMLTLRANVGKTLAEASKCQQTDLNAVYLTRAAEINRYEMFSETCAFNGSFNVNT